MGRFLRSRRWIALLLLLVCVLLAAPRLSRMTVEDIIHYTPSSLPLAAMALLLVYCVKSFVMVIPILALYLSAGLLFPPLPAVLITYLGVFCEVSIGYLLGRRLGHEKVWELMAKRHTNKRFLSFRQKNGAGCLLARILPFPFDLVSLFFGATGMGFFQYTVISLLGVSPFMIPSVVAGSAARTPLTKEFLIPFSISMSVTVCVFLLLRRLQKHRQPDQAVQEKEG